MYKNIFRTFVSRIIAALLTFAVVFISSRALGPENYGTIGLIMVAISIALLFSALIGGTSLVFFTSRVDPSALFTISSIWGILMSLVISGAMALLDLYPSEYFIYVFLISLIANISQNLMFIILGRERILQQNIINVAQVFTHFVVLSFLFHGMGTPSIKFYLTSVLISHSVAAMIGIICCHKEIFPLRLSGLALHIAEIVRYGFWVQLSAFVQLFNYRLSYYLVDWFLGREMLGIYTLAVQLAESFWILPRSVAIVQFAHISNLRESKDAVNLSYKLMQLVVIIIALGSIPIFFIPEHWLIFVFGYGYAGIKSVLMMLIPAIIIFSGSIILSHFFSGIGKVWVNTITGFVGLIFTFFACMFLIPSFELTGAAIATNISYADDFYRITDNICLI
jgi:O-antigen/teichoic acid export membrane protein